MLRHYFSRHRHVKRYKKATQISFRLSSAGQLQWQHVDYLLASNNMDELKKLELIEQLCRNLRRQQEQQREEQQSITPTG